MLVNLKINNSSIKKNLEKIRSINKNMICVIKDDAYGLKIEKILPVLIKNNCNYFAVAYLEEAVKVYKILKNFKNLNKKNNCNVMTLNYVEPKKLEVAIKNGIEITIFSKKQFYDYIDILNNFKKNICLKIHIKINSGMNRLGFDENEVFEIIKEIKKINSEFLKDKKFKLEIISIFSHISEAENKTKTEKQVKKFEKILKIFDDNEIKYKYRHLQASPLLFKYEKKYNYDFCRVGMAIYGLEPLSYDVGLENAILVESKIINIREVKKDEKVSYGNKGILKRDSKVGIVAIGYAHGLPKQIENKKNCAYVLVNDKKANILGEICMDMIFIDLTDIQDIKIGDKVLIVGNKKSWKNKITLRQMAKWGNTIQDDVLTNFKIDKKKIFIIN
ncbi:alanine racemase [Leptotrichia sp. oral taxon 218]|jgi:alanine racemase|uniref:alanine racemase n=1 Tax=Leptotrichia sp. oral taxon 218 TaxID=712361 RepID=UPI001B8BBE38|nr:alanine racemase [Leptotrichia sp. oral taxon 218]QUB94755.1 alanine racemase [Leptotrichia sp. oral taxon 218]